MAQQKSEILINGIYFGFIISGHYQNLSVFRLSFYRCRLCWVWFRENSLCSLQQTWSTFIFISQLYCECFSV